VISKLPIQLWPNCGAFVEKARLWNHLSCPKWFEHFCLYCRWKFTKNHMNPLSTRACSSLMQTKRSKIKVSTTPGIVFQSKWKMMWILIFLLLISPLVTVTLMPYIVYKNILLKKSKSCINSGMNYLLGTLIFILWFCGFPVLWPITIFFYFYVLWHMMKRKTKSQPTDPN
jgi:hypothetical protein